MNQDERTIDFHALGLEIKRKRKEKGWTQEQFARLLDRTDRTVINIENKGQCPSIGIFFKIVTLLGISVDQFFYPSLGSGEDERLKHIERLLYSLTEDELYVIEATAEAIKKARDIRQNTFGEGKERVNPT